MKIILNKRKLINILKHKRDLGFVPTMGSIHKGHISLIKKSIKLSQETIVSIFINKHQFNRKIDYQKYPKNIEKDTSILRKCNVDYLYLPPNKQIYPNGPSKKIKINTLSKKLCGKFRPNHFEAVADVVNSLVKIIKPSKIFFGEKDMQQLKIMEDFFKKKKIKIKVIYCKTIRENNGIACSSRNVLLLKKQKAVASNVYKLISKNKNQLLKKNYLLKKIKAKILKMGVEKIDYLKILDINKLIKPFKKNVKFRIFIAYYLGKTRLIDNI